ncbi:MAG: phosphoadenylyl-sulfate reductase [Pseudomonadota bacterium]|nr:phosphoadenylyl-sulfate reductase [Pseudomonadota bacterium]
MTAVAIRKEEGEEDALAARARRLSAQYGGEDAADIIRRAVLQEFPGRIALVSSFGAESAPLLHLVAEAAPETPVLFLDTGKHFAQTLSYRKKLARELGLKNIVDIHPDAEHVKSADPRGDLWRADTDACCNIRKVIPLEKALQGYDAWITGRKQFHGGERVALPVFEASGRFIKVNPIVRWRPDDIAAYAAAHALPAHPLVEQGYPSIGCWPCTHPAAPGEDPRAGRWRGAAKTECGIHRIGRQVGAAA